MKIVGRPKYSAAEIEEQAAVLLRWYQSNYFDFVRPTPLKDITKFISDKHKVTFNFKASLGFSENGERIMGATNLKKWIVLVDESLQKDEHKFNFTLAHELGHLALHRKVILIRDQSEEKEPVETVKEAFNERNSLISEFDWLEWQANAYATALLMPEMIFCAAVAMQQKEMGIGRRGKIFVDNQPCNKKDYYEIMNRLSTYFRVSITAIEYRLKKLNLVEYHLPGIHSISEILASGDWLLHDDKSPF